MSNKVYFNVFETSTHFEYHISAERSLVVAKLSMSKRVPKSSDMVGTIILRWFNEARAHELIRIEAFE
jgi:hypothetical protein